MSLNYIINKINGWTTVEVQTGCLRATFVFFSITSFWIVLLGVGAFDLQVCPPRVGRLIAIFGPGYRKPTKNSKCPMPWGLPGRLPRGGCMDVSTELTHNITYASNMAGFTFSGCANLNNCIPRFFKVISRARNENKMTLGSRIRELPG